MYFPISKYGLKRFSASSRSSLSTSATSWIIHYPFSPVETEAAIESCFCKKARTIFNAEIIAIKSIDLHWHLIPTSLQFKHSNFTARLIIRMHLHRILSSCSYLSWSSYAFSPPLPLYSLLHFLPLLYHLLLLQELKASPHRSPRIERSGLVFVLSRAILCIYPGFQKGDSSIQQGLYTICSSEL